MRKLLRAFVFGAATVVCAVGQSSGQQIADVYANAVVVPANLSPTLEARRLSNTGTDLRPGFDATEAAAPELTQALLQSYVDHQQQLKALNGVQSQSERVLTSDVLMGYIARSQVSNPALDAIANVEVVSTPAPTAPAKAEPGSKPALTEDVLAHYVDQRFVPTPRRLKLADDERLCLTQAIYHEARGESREGQIAVANIIINRAFSGRFPSTICGVVFQNADKGRYRCQFSFACDGRSDMGTERRAWANSERLAEDAYHEFVLGQRPGVVPNSALFYHTRSVSPDWSHSFQRVATIGAHIFYAPRR